MVAVLALNACSSGDDGAASVDSTSTVAPSTPIPTSTTTTTLAPTTIATTVPMTISRDSRLALPKCLDKLNATVVGYAAIQASAFGDTGDIDDVLTACIELRDQLAADDNVLATTINNAVQGALEAVDDVRAFALNGGDTAGSTMSLLYAKIDDYAAQIRKLT